MKTQTRGALALFAYVAMSLLALGSSDFDAKEQAALTAAVDRVAPAVVRIDTVGGVERMGETLFGTGPTTGVVVDPEGYIISSAFNFVNKPSSILVLLPNGTRKPAKLVATDHSRMLVLLKVDVEKPLSTCDAVPRKEMRVGQWAVAVGRGFSGDRPSMAVGIVSALDRIWGKAIQTDAAVSPNNYGGPLVDIRGRVLGVLVPLSSETTEEMAGVEWYDSGIGFAIPLEDIQRVLPRMKKGEDLRPGVAGLSLKGPNLYTGDAILAACRPKSPAMAAGLRPGDRIVEIDGRTIARSADVRQEIGRRYAGDTMRIKFTRDKEQLDRELTLVAKLEPFQHGFLGILPMRSGASGGVSVRHVYPESPAAKAGIAVGDVITAFQGEPVSGRDELALKMGAIEPGAEVLLEMRTNGAARTVRVKLAAIPENAPSEDLPPAAGPTKSEKDADKIRETGAIRLKTPEFSNETWAYVPSAIKQNQPCGVVVWLHGSGGYEWRDLLPRWKTLCERHALILVAPKAMNSSRWMLGEAALVDRLLAEVSTTYAVDPARVVVCGYESGGTLAYFAGCRNRETVRAVVAVEALLRGRPPENDPLSRLAVYAACSGKSPVARSMESAVATLRGMKIPVAMKNLGDVPRDLNADELAEVARWIDTLDRI